MTTREICISEHLTFLTKIIYITFQKTLPVWNIWRRTQKRCFQSTSLRPCYRTAWTDASSTSTTSVSASGPLGGGSEAPLHPCPLLEIPVQKGISTRVKKPHISKDKAGALQDRACHLCYMPVTACDDKTTNPRLLSQNHTTVLYFPFQIAIQRSHQINKPKKTLVLFVTLFCHLLFWAE